MFSLRTKDADQLRRVLSEFGLVVLHMVLLVVILWFAFDLSAPINYLASEGLLPQELAINFTVSCGALGLALWLWLLWSTLLAWAGESKTSETQLSKSVAEESWRDPADGG